MLDTLPNGNIYEAFLAFYRIRLICVFGEVIFWLTDTLHSQFDAPIFVLWIKSKYIATLHVLSKSVSIHSIHIDGLVQERRNSSALAMELRLSFTNPSI